MLLIFCKFKFRVFFYWFNTVPFLISRKIQYLIARHECSGIFETTRISSACTVVAAGGDCWNGGIPRPRVSGVRIVEDGGADGFSVIDRCRALRAAVSLGLPPVVEVGYRRAAWTTGTALGAATVATSLIAGLFGPLGIVACALVLSLPIWVTAIWLSRRRQPPVESS